MEGYRLTARVTGRVQMVGFRYSARQKAAELKLTGWVRNEPDGSVSVCAEGSRAALEMMEEWLHQGPPSAQVSGVDSRWAPAQGTFSRFSVEM